MHVYLLVFHVTWQFSCFLFDSFRRLWIVSREKILLSELGWMLRVGRSNLWICFLTFFPYNLSLQSNYDALPFHFIFILSRQLFPGWESCIWTYMLSGLKESIRCPSFLSFFFLKKNVEIEYFLFFFSFVYSWKSAVLYHGSILLLSPFLE